MWRATTWSQLEHGRLPLLVHPPDTTPPTVVSTTPASGATGVSASSNVVATFSEPMNPSSITTSSFTLQPTSGGANIPAVVSYSGTTATLNPTTNLAAGVNTPQQYQQP